MTVIGKLIAADRAKKLSILVIGDAMTDVYIHGHFGTCQEECYKFVEERRVLCAGGAKNAAGQLGHWNVITYHFHADEKHNSTKTRYLVNGKFVFRHDDDRRPPEDEVAFNEQETMEFLQHGENVHGILISDYDKGFLSPEFIRRIIKLANERGIPVVADAKRHPSIYAGAILKTNEAYDNKYDSDFEDEVRICTYGHLPPILDDNHYSFENASYIDVPCVNHVGAGDCFAAHLTLALAHGLSLEESAAIAFSAGRVYVQHEQNRAPWPHEIRKDMDPVQGKVCTDLGALRQSVPDKIVFTNGVFRVPHAGHAWLMRWAKEQGDTLVVGINTDESAAKVKPGEFCLPLEERIEILASMDCVDWIVPFSEDTPEAVIEELCPDFLVKGSEYTGCRIPGQQIVGDDNILIAPESPFPNRSSSAIVAEIHEARKRKT